MPVTPEDMLQTADELFQSHVNEVERRNAATRSYYSFFHFANRYASQNADVPPSAMSGGTHLNLAEYFSNTGNHPQQKSARVRKIGILLRHCHRVRCDADYELDEKFEEGALTLHHSQCIQGIEAVKAL